MRARRVSVDEADVRRGRSPGARGAVAPWVALQSAAGNAALATLAQAGERRTAERGPSGSAQVQRAIEHGRLNIVGEQHTESEQQPRRDREKAFAREQGFEYWTEAEFHFTLDGRVTPGDSLAHRVLQSASFLAVDLESLVRVVALTRTVVAGGRPEDVEKRRKKLLERTDDLQRETRQLDLAARELDGSGTDDVLVDAATDLADSLHASIRRYHHELEDLADEDERGRGTGLDGTAQELATRLPDLRSDVASLLRAQGYDERTIAAGHERPESVVDRHIVAERSLHMLLAGNHAAHQRVGLWKVGDEHVRDMQGQETTSFALTTRDEFEPVFTAWLEASGHGRGDGGTRA